MSEAYHNGRARGRQGPPPGAPISDEDARRLALEWVRLLLRPGQVTELRAVGVRGYNNGRPHVRAGFFDFDHAEEMVTEALDLTHAKRGNARGVYLALNPLRPDILARCANRVDYAEDGAQAKDGDIIRRRWLMVDVDPVRDGKVSATDAEKAAAWEVIQCVAADLRGRGWPDPVTADSGNGYHLLYPVKLPADDGGMVRRVLAALAKKHDTAEAKIDPSTFNPARLVKFPGTLARKGDSTDDRPHRRARLLVDLGQEVAP
jgi:hypothetical protein